MRIELFVVVVALWSIGIAPSFAQNSPLCKMTEAEAKSSSQCVRWHFVCSLGGVVLGKPAKKFASLPYKMRQRLAIEATFAIAEQQCEHFDYSEANDAVSAKLRMIGIE